MIERARESVKNISVAIGRSEFFLEAFAREQELDLHFDLNSTLSKKAKARQAQL